MVHTDCKDHEKFLCVVHFRKPVEEKLLATSGGRKSKETREVPPVPAVLECFSSSYQRSLAQYQLPLAGCVTLGKTLNFSVPHLPTQKMRLSIVPTSKGQ
jgi:hypothetical protein